MKEELIQELIATIRGTKSFILSEAPNVLRQAVHFQIACTLLGVLFGLGFFFYVYWCFQKGAALTANHKEHFDWMFFLAISGVLALVIGLAMLCQNIPALLQVLMAPKLYLLEYLSRLLK